jgi:hypothetical protein
MLSFRLEGALSSRQAARQFRGSLLNEPPRITRDAPALCDPSQKAPESIDPLGGVFHLIAAERGAR